MREEALPKIMTTNDNQDEITYLREENKTKTIIIQTLLENQKITQSAPNLFPKPQFINLTEPITDKDLIKPTHFTSTLKYATQVIRYKSLTVYPESTDSMYVRSK